MPTQFGFGKSDNRGNRISSCQIWPNMIRKTCHRYNSPGDSHFLTFSCFRRQPFLKNKQPRIWFCESLAGATRSHNIALWGYVIMPEHVHLIVSPREADYNISRFLNSVKQSVTRKAYWYRQKSDKPDNVWEQFYDVHPDGKVHFRFWQRGGGYDRNIWSADELREKLEYMHNNPVRRGLCDAPDQWYWSSAGTMRVAKAGLFRLRRPTCNCNGTTCPSRAAGMAPAAP